MWTPDARTRSARRAVSGNASKGPQMGNECSSDSEEDYPIPSSHDNNRGNSAVFHFISLIVLSLAIQLPVAYLYYSNARRMDGITDALIELCGQGEDEHIRDCLIRKFSKQESKRETTMAGLQPFIGNLLPPHRLLFMISSKGEDQKKVYQRKPAAATYATLSDKHQGGRPKESIPDNQTNITDWTSRIDKDLRDLIQDVTVLKENQKKTSEWTQEIEMEIRTLSRNITSVTHELYNVSEELTTDSLDKKNPTVWTRTLEERMRSLNETYILLKLGQTELKNSTENNEATIKGLSNNISALKEKQENVTNWAAKMEQEVQGANFILGQLKKNVTDNNELLKHDNTDLKILIEENEKILRVDVNSLRKQIKYVSQAKQMQREMSQFINILGTLYQCQINDSKSTTDIKAGTQQLNINIGTLMNNHETLLKVVEEMMANVSNITNELNIAHKNLRNITNWNMKLEQTTSAINEENKRVQKMEGTVLNNTNVLGIVEQNMTKIADAVEVQRRNITEWMPVVNKTFEDMKHVLATLDRNQTNLTQWSSGIEADTHTLNTNVTSLANHHANVTHWAAFIETNISQWIGQLEVNTSAAIDSLALRHNQFEDFLNLSKHQSRETYTDLAYQARYQSLFSFVLVGLFVWMVVLTVCLNTRRRSEEYNVQSSHNRHQSRETQSVKQSTGKPLHNAACVIGFHSETEKKHRQCVRGLCSAIAHSPEVIGFTVCRHNDLREIPRARVYVMFVDFNERNVILEDPRKGLGDLRLLTVRCLWELGGDVILVYSGDEISGRLGENELFSSELTSIFNHAELTHLKNHDRMFSMHRQLTNYQRNHIRRVISKATST